MSQTSSPSYLLLASLDGACATLAARNAAAVDTQGQRFRADVRALRDRVLLRACPCLRASGTARSVLMSRVLYATWCRVANAEPEVCD